METHEIRYTTKDLADMLGVEAVTIRKYSLALEKAGYDIDRSDGKNRSFTDTDVMAFKYLQTLRSRTGISVDAAADIVAARSKAATEQDVSIVRSESVTIQDRYDDERYDMLAAKISEILEFRELFLQQQQEVATLTLELAEARKELAEARQETAVATNQLSGRIENVEGNLRDEIRREQEQTRAQLGEILSRVETYGKRKKFLGLF